MSLFCCNNQLNPFQRRFARICSLTLLLTAVFFAFAVSFREHHASPALVRTFALLPILPFVAMMLVIPRYFAQEKDEFVRTVVMRALLWAFALPMVIDTVWGFIWPLSHSISILNLDIFCITALFAITWQVRRYQ